MPAIIMDDKGYILDGYGNKKTRACMSTQERAANNKARKQLRTPGQKSYAKARREEKKKYAKMRAVDEAPSTPTTQASEQGEEPGEVLDVLATPIPTLCSLPKYIASYETEESLVMVVRNTFLEARLAQPSLRRSSSEGEIPYSNTTSLTVPWLDEDTESGKYDVSGMSRTSGSFTDSYTCLSTSTPTTRTPTSSVVEVSSSNGDERFLFTEVEPCWTKTSKAEFPSILSTMLSTWDLPEPDWETLPSIGSAGHHTGSFRPCNFLRRGVCYSGRDCTHCHYAHARAGPGKKSRISTRRKKSTKQDDTIKRIGQ
jgi:hypothetical protein